MKKYKIFDVYTHAYTMVELCDYLVNDFENKKTIYSINPEITYSSLKDEEIVTILNSGSVNIVDGVGVVKAIKYLYGDNVERVTGIDLVEEIIKGPLKVKKIFLFGAKDGVAKQAASNLNNKYNSNIIGYCSGYHEDYSQVVEMINDSGAEILFVGLGYPKQEKFIYENFDKFTNVKLAMVVGGSFDVLSGNVKRAPKIFLRLNLEWLYRLLTNPSRIGRQVKLLKFAREVLKRGKQNEKKA